MKDKRSTKEHFVRDHCATCEKSEMLDTMKDENERLKNRIVDLEFVLRQFTKLDGG
jgi:hypothetical protein